MRSAEPFIQEDRRCARRWARALLTLRRLSRRTSDSREAQRRRNHATVTSKPTRSKAESLRWWSDLAAIVLN